jgi:glycosyltransferase involved in cell wall biosynthesis
MDLQAFPPVAFPLYSQGAVRLLSAGPLVEFSGFRHLIAACAQLRSRGLDFTCEIIGDGPLREALQAQITEENLRPIVTLTGAATQQELLEKLRSCDIFTLAAIVDAAWRDRCAPGGDSRGDGFIACRCRDGCRRHPRGGGALQHRVARAAG